MTSPTELYQQLIVDHSKKPRNFGKLEGATHFAEGFNPLCGDHLWVYLIVDDQNIITDISFEGSGCAISKASASLMTMELKGKNIDYAKNLFNDFHGMLTAKDLSSSQENTHGKIHSNSRSSSPSGLPAKLSIFSNIWQYPARVKCAALSWHAMSGALNKSTKVSTE